MTLFGFVGMDVSVPVIMEHGRRLPDDRRSGLDGRGHPLIAFEVSAL
jgi:hypothetical protein